MSKPVENYPRDFLHKLLRDMVLIRRFEEKCAQMYGLRKIGGFCHLYIGQEAVAVGSIAVLDLKRDYVVTAYRDHGLALVCGMEPNALMAELFGKITGCSRGKGGSMHLFDVSKGMYGGNGIVGAQIPIATGIALKIRYKEESGVVICYFGDGAIHQGVFHESLNMAKLWKLPIVYICENNQYGMGTDFHRVSAIHDFALKSASYGIPGKQVNGMDVLEVYHEVSSAVDLAREQELPSFLEIKTYRYKGHSMSDPAKYRTQEEVDAYRMQDPIIIFKQRMSDAKVLTEDEFQTMDEACIEVCNKSVEFAEQSPEPALTTLYQDVIA